MYRCCLTSVKLCYMYGYVGLERGAGLGRGEARGLGETEQSLFNMGPEWSDVHTLLCDGHHPSGGFFAFKDLAHEFCLLDTIV
jgi:hypothetical protein